MTTRRLLIDASIIASSWESFKHDFIESEDDIILVLSSITIRELEDRKKDKFCKYSSVRFAKSLLALFAKNKAKTEVILTTEECGHLDRSLVELAAQNNYEILTCDNGMATWCRAYKVAYTLLEVEQQKRKVDLPFVVNQDGLLSINLFDHSIPRDTSVYVVNIHTDKKLSPLEDGTIFLGNDVYLLVAHPDSTGCCVIDRYSINSSKFFLEEHYVYGSFPEAKASGKPNHISLCFKWMKHMQIF